MKIIIAGGGYIGTMLVEKLYQEHELLIINKFFFGNDI